MDNTNTYAGCYVRLFQQPMEREKGGVQGRCPEMSVVGYLASSMKRSAIVVRSGALFFNQLIRLTESSDYMMTFLNVFGKSEEIISSHREEIRSSHKNTITESSMYIRVDICVSSM